MAKFNIELGVTVNYETKSISFMRVNAGIQDIDLDAPYESQLESFDEKFGMAYNELGDKIRQGVLKQLKETKG